jgi:hypothetical protein
MYFEVQRDYLRNNSTVRSKKEIRVGCDQKFQLAIRYNFNYQMSVLKVRLVILKNVAILIFIKVCIMCDLSVIKES